MIIQLHVRNACACQQASKWLEKICRCQQRLLPLRWLHVRSNCNSRLQGKRKLQIEFLVALAPQLLVADLLEPWNSHETVPYGPYQRCGNSITRRLCAESLHHLRVRVPPGFDLQIIAGGLPKVPDAALRVPRAFGLSYLWGVGPSHSGHLPQHRMPAALFGQHPSRLSHSAA